jgi:uncharacterized protein YgiM (DUF1202 family)
MLRCNALPVAITLFLSVGLAYAEEPNTASSNSNSTTPVNQPLVKPQQPVWEVKEVAPSKQWISDRLEAPLRSCPGDRCKVVKIVKPGFETTLIGLTNDGWALVTSGDVKGYLPKR